MIFKFALTKYTKSELGTVASHFSELQRCDNQEKLEMALKEVIKTNPRKRSAKDVREIVDRINQDSSDTE